MPANYRSEQETMYCTDVGLAPLLGQHNIHRSDSVTTDVIRRKCRKRFLTSTMQETEQQSAVRGCLNLPFALTLYLATLFGSHVAMGIGGIVIHSLFLGLPIFFIAVFTVACILQARDRVPPVPISTSMPIALLTSVIGTVAMHLPLLIHIELSKAAILASLVATSSLLAGLSTFGYAEVVRDQFPPNGGHRTDVP
ncbi:hypothetical protein SH528x_003020 [Novipirellula sp. SH528]|uniref:hypothetical protein n=1 Tax=Novipirellula sp. SH528 TaxID=3454466 RepID=UPI003FA09636